MNSSGEFSRFMRDIFYLDNNWVDWFMRDVFRENQLHVFDTDNRVTSVMLSTPYSMDFHGRKVGCEYISYVATLPYYRGRGQMRRLMNDTLNDVSRRGIPFAALIPASRQLYFIYDSMGFATVFYVDEQRYTSLHSFESDGYQLVEADFPMFARLENLREGNIIHTREDFSNIIKDIELSNGIVVAVSDGGSSEAIAFVDNSHEIKVFDLLSTDEKAAEAALAEVRKQCGEKSIIIYTTPGNNLATLRARGMIRITNVEAALAELAAAEPRIKFAVRVKDDMIAANNGIFVINNGKCFRKDYKDDSIKLSFDVNVKVLAEIMFSHGSIGELFDIPSKRPYISLMLD